VISRVILDTGPLVALLNRRDAFHPWAKGRVAQVKPPLLTCEPVLTEAFHLLRSFGEARLTILEMLRQQLIRVQIRLDEEHYRVLDLLRRYSGVPMALADACLVRMSETICGSTVLTLDTDFTIFRQHKRVKIPLLIPPDR
jgi:uncharacterized protein